MRVAFDVGSVRARPTGVGVFGASAATALAAELEPHELALIGRRRDAEGLPTGVVVRGRPTWLPYVPWVELQSALDARRVGADLVHYTDGVVPVVRSGRTVLSVHDLSVVAEWRSHPVRRYARIGFVLASPALADLIVAPSRATADELVRLTRTPASKIELVPYAPQQSIRPATESEVAEVTRRHGLTAGSYVLGLGTLEPRKNHLRLVEAFSRLALSGRLPRDATLVLAGGLGWRHESILAAIESSPVRPRINRLGYVPASDLPALLTGAGAVAYPSTYEGLGLPVLEALACGAPTVTSNVSSLPEVGGSAAILVDPFSVDAIADGIVEAWRAGVTDRARVAAAGRAHAGTFTWQRVARELVDIYRKLTG
jgi:glycosyltransferase involved in cell wall biosynthesis